MPESLKNLIEMIHYLPWIGEKTAAKLAFFLLKANESYVSNFANSLKNLQSSLRECKICHSMTDFDKPICSICSDSTRKESELCVVEDYLDMLSIERTWVFRWKYHILGWAISPISWVNPENLNFDSLFSRIENNSEISEIILATNPNIEGEATALYAIERMPREVRISRLSKGLPHAGSIEYADEITLLSAFKWRS